MPHSDHPRTEPVSSPDRRQFLRAAGAGTALSSLAGRVAGARQAATDTSTEAGTADDRRPTDGRPARIHPAFGYPGLADETVPDALSPDHVVEMVTRTPVEDALGDFVFDPVGLHVDPGDVVDFVATWPEHAVAGYHNALGRWQRVPDAVGPLTSPVAPVNGFWLYRFSEPGVYDLYCAPRESLGMVMRVAVGDRDEWPVTRNREGRPPLEAARAVFDRPALDPAAVSEAGTVAWDDLSLPADVSTAARPPTGAGPGSPVESGAPPTASPTEPPSETTAPTDTPTDPA